MSNMGDEMVGVSLQVGTQLVGSATHITEKTFDIIARLMQFIAEKSNSKEVKENELAAIATGEVTTQKLKKSARATNDSLSVIQNAIKAEDKKYIANAANKYGIPVSFIQIKGKDNVHIQVRNSDVNAMKLILSEMAKEKVKVSPQTLGNFKVNAWEMKHLTEEFNKYDLSAQFIQFKSGEYACVYDKKDEKAILMARGEFVRNVNEVNKELNMQLNDSDNFYVIKDSRSNREISFDDIPSRLELSSQIQEKFGYNVSKADIACSKFGEENLSGDEKKKFFSDNPQNEFSKIDTNINLEGESIHCKAYSCFRLTPKADGVPKIVYSNNEGKFVILSPEKMTNKQMSRELKNGLNIKDEAIIAALVDKANKVNDFYVSNDKENFKLDYEFKKEDFDMSNPDTVKGMLRQDADGNTFTKTLPIDKIENNIERTSKDSFTVTSTATISETDVNGNVQNSSDTQVLVLSFSDKKNAIADVAELYKKQGIPDYAAVQMAKDVYKKAELQSPEKVVSIEEVRADSIKLSYNDKINEILTDNSNDAVTEISEKYEISKEHADTLLEKADEYRKVDTNINFDDENKNIERGNEIDTDEKVDTNINFSEKESSISQEVNLNKDNSIAENLSNNSNKLPEIEAPKLPDNPPPMTRGRT